MRQYVSVGAILLLSVASSAPFGAEIYRQVDEQGNVTYTNKAEKGAAPVKLKPLSVYGAPAVKGAVNSHVNPLAKQLVYRKLAIVSPQADETVRDNPGNITIVATSEPALSGKKGHRYQFYLDGKPVGEPRAAVKIALKNVDRGEHQVSVAIVDAGGKTLLRSEPTRFFLHRQTLFNPARRSGGN